MIRNSIFTLICLLAALAFIGCAETTDSPTQPTNQADLSAAVVSGDIDQDEVAFTFSSAAPGDPDPMTPGRLLVQGSNLHYDAELGALLVDLTLVNASDREFPEPVRLTFTRLIPPDVTVLNADNGETAVGAAFDFQFENDDAMWTPGEQTMPRTVQFGVDPEVSIGFVSRIDMGDPQQGGAIGGLVWHDENEDGLQGPEEVGMPRVRLVLHAGLEPDSSRVMAETMTVADGTYRFENLADGHYTVVLRHADGLQPTTSPIIQVLLVATEDGVSDFLMADFGCQMLTAPDDSLEIGDCVQAKGEYQADPDRLAAENFCICDGDDDCDDCDNDDVDNACWGRLSGPVTAIDAENQALAVMGTWVYFTDWDDKLDDDPVEIGQRVRVNASLVSGEGGDRIIGCRLHTWNGNRDRVRGWVQEIIRDEDDEITGVRVLNTLVTLR